MKLIAFLKSKWFWINLALSFVVGVILIFLFFSLLKSYTLFGESMTLPDLRGMNYSQAENNLKDRNLNYQVIDSVYVADQPQYTIVDQNPVPNSKVKRNRTVYLTVSTSTPPEVQLPNVTSVSLNQAIRMLESYGLVMGDRIYVPDIALNSVIAVRINGKLVEPGTTVLQGTKIDLVLGDGMIGTQDKVPSLMGLTQENAMLVLRAFGFNLGNVFYDPDTKNRSTAVIYRQSPEPKPNVTIPPGEVVDIWLMDKAAYDQLQSLEDEPDGDGEFFD